MTWMLPAADGPDLARRLARGDALLGAACQDPVDLAVAVRAGVDFVVTYPGVALPVDVPAFVATEDPRLVPRGAAGVLARVASMDDARALVDAAPPELTVAVLGLFGDDQMAVLRRTAAEPLVVARLRVVSSPDEVRPGDRGLVVGVTALLARAFGDLRSIRAAPFSFDGSRSHERVALVMLPGMLGSAELWDTVAAGVADLALPIAMRIDLDDSVEEMAESVLAAAPERFVLAGHSLGAIVALEVAHRSPNRVLHLALVAASARGPNERQQHAWRAAADRTRAGDFEAVASELAVAALPGGRPGDPGLVARAVAMARRVGPEGFLRQLAAQQTRPDSRERVGTLGMPVTVVSGEADAVCPPDLQAELVRLCPSAEFVTVPGAGHLVPMECPHELIAVLRDRLLAAAPIDQ